MKNIYLFLFFLLLNTLSKQSNAQTYHWSVLTGDSTINQDFASCIEKDASNNLIVCGWFRGQIQLDPASSSSYNLTSTGASAFIVKYSYSGVFQWAKAIQGNAYVSINDVATDANNNIYVTGTHASSTDFDPGPGVATRVSLGGSSNMFVAKYDSNGNFKWANTCGSSGNTDAGYAIHVDALNNVMVAGHFTATAYFDPALSAGGQIQAISGLDAFIAKYDQLGNFQWVKGWAASKMFGLTSDNAGSVYAFSEFDLTMDTDPGTGVSNIVSNGDVDIFLIKLSAAGNFIWGKSIGSNGYESAGSIKFANNSLYICGQYSDTMDIDFGAGVTMFQPINNGNAYIAKCDTSGNLSWAKTIGDSSYIRFEDLHIASNNDITVVGEYFSYSINGLDINPGSGIYYVESNSKVETGVILRLDANGNFKNGFDIENSDRMILYDVVTDDNNNAFVVGYYTDSVYINPSSSSLSAISKGYEDILIAKYSFDSPSNTLDEVDDSFVLVYPNPANNEVTISWKNDDNQPNQILLFNSLGALISKYPIEEKFEFRKTIKTNHLTKGMYIVQLISRDGMNYSKKLTIE
ncbi:MAG TPA: T9SS type A sorting domain-containing protein [Chitinophagaceae bacterium]|nr:T9SS type A sorting domain-containing protein [Chitinophagaceae bacterium]